jgi:hypothetical protein
MPSNWYSCLCPPLCGIILPDQQPLNALVDWPPNRPSFTAITAFGFLSPAKLRCCAPCVSRLILVLFIGWASRSSSLLAARIISYVALAGHCTRHWLLTAHIAYISCAYLRLGSGASLPSSLPTYHCCLGRHCLPFTPLSLTLQIVVILVVVAFR